MVDQGNTFSQVDSSTIAIRDRRARFRRFGHQLRRVSADHDGDVVEPEHARRDLDAVAVGAALVGCIAEGYRQRSRPELEEMMLGDSPKAEFEIWEDCDL